MFLYDSTDIPLGAWIQSADPAVDDADKLQPGVLWIDTTSAPYVWKKRDSGNTGWDTLTFAVGAGSITDAELLAIAGLTSAADKLPYFTGSGTAALADFTAFARTLVDDADAATALATLGAAPLASPTFTGVPAAPTAAGGTNTTQIATTAYVVAAIAALIASAPGALDTLDELAAALGDDANFAATVTTALAGKQPLHAILTALAGLTIAADKLPYGNGSNTFAVTDLTSFARTLLDDANAAAARATLDAASLGTANSFTAVQTFGKATIHTPVVLSDAAPIATDASLGTRFEVSSSTDRTLAAPSNPTHGQQCVWTWKNTDSGSRTLTLTTGSSGAFRYTGTIAGPLAATAAGKKMRFTATYDSADARWDVDGYNNDIG